MRPEERKELMLNEKKLPVDWNFISRETADFIITQGETLLKETHDIWDSFDKKINNLKILFIAIFTGLIGIIVKMDGEWSSESNLKISILFSTVFMFILIAYLLWLTLPRKYSTLGNFPSGLLSTTVIREDNNAKQDIELKSSTMIHLESKIEKNTIRNTKMSLHYHVLVFLFVLNIGMSIVIY